MTNYNKAFSLIEVMIFTVVFSLFFVTAATVVTTTLRISNENQNKIKATHYVEEIAAWLNSEKELDWGGSVYSGSANSFTEQATIKYTGPGTTTDFCFDVSPMGAWPASGTVNCDFVLNNQFRRIATFSATVVDNYVNQINASISTEWKEGNSVRSTLIQKTFSIWE